MSVDDHGLEVLKKSGEQVIPGDQSEHYIKVSNITSGVVVASGNTSVIALGGAGSFVGSIDSVLSYPEITISLAGAPSVAPGTLFFEFSPDGVNFDISISTTLAGPNSLVSQPLRTVLPFFRVRYVNGATPLTEFRLTTVYHWVSAKHLTRFLSQSIDENEPVENVRAIVAGKSPNGPFTNLPATGEIDSNSTSAPLGISGTFTGAIEPSTGFISASVTVISDVDSAIGGLMFEWYSDLAGTILLKDSTFTYGSSPAGINISVPIQGPFFRISYTNGAIAQATFNLLGRLTTSSPPPDVVAIDDVVTGNNAASVTKSNIVGLQENGTFANVGLSNQGNIKVAIADRPSEVRSRTRVEIPIANIALVPGGTVLYTVTASTTLYVESFLINQLNDDTTDGEWTLGDNALVKSTFILPSRVGGTPSSAAAASPTLPEPMPFTTNVNVTEVTGIINISGFIIGYEEPN